MADNLINISSEYDMLSIMRNIGRNYFGDDISEQRIGMFGHLTESLAHIFGASIIDASSRSKEFNIITANKYSTLLQEAEKLKLTIGNAEPMTIVAYIGVPTKSIISTLVNGGYSTIISDSNNMHPTYKMVLEKDTTITISGYNFMFEYDIQITATWSTKRNSYVYSAKYLTNGDIDETSYKDNPNINGYKYPVATTLTELTNNNIQSFVTNREGVELLLLRVNLKQMKKITQYYNIIKNDMISLTGLDFFYDNMISHFNIYYKKNGENTWSYVNPVSIYSSSIHEDNTVQYEIIHDSSKLRLSITDFTPEYNSEFMVDIYTTQGSDINSFEYIGDGSDVTITPVSFNDRHNYTGLELACYPINTLTEGKDIPTIDEIKQKLILLKPSLNSVDTDYDLYNYIKQYDLVNDYVFIKKRSDVIERRYGLFTIPRLTTGDIMPSSTLNLVIPYNEDFIKVDNKNYEIDGLIYQKDSTDNIENIIIRSGTPFILTKDFDEKVILDDGNPNGLFTDDVNYYNSMMFISDKLMPSSNDKFSDFDRKNYISLLDTSHTESIKDESGEIKLINPFKDNHDKTIKDICELTKIYTSPYTIVYNLENQLTSYYLPSISENIYLNMVADEIETSVNFSVDHLSIERNAMQGENSYKITIKVMPNGKYDSAIFNNNYNINEVANTIMVKGFIYTTEENVGKKVDGYFDFNFLSYSDGIFTFTSDIIIDDTIDESANTTHMLNFYDAEDIHKLEGTNVVTIISSSGDEYNYIDAKYNEIYAHLNVFNLQLGIGIYYLDREGIQDKGAFIKNITDVNGGIKTIVTKSDDKYKLATNVVGDETNAIEYPRFGMLCDYENESAIDIEYTLCNVYDNTSNDIKLYIDMSDFVRSYSEVGFIDSAPKSLLIKEVPLVQYSKISDNDFCKRFFNIIYDTKDILLDINSKITNNFSLDYKLFRTYGPCEYFKLSTTDGESRKVIGRVDSNLTEITLPGIKELGNLDIKITFNVLIRNNLSVSDNDVILQLKKYIKEYIEKLNNTESNYTMYLSNLITELENNFINLIKSVELVSINDNSDIYRVLIYDLPEELQQGTLANNSKNILKYIPEYINVPLENIIINIQRTKY